MSIISTLSKLACCNSQKKRLRQNPKLVARRNKSMHQFYLEKEIHNHSTSKHIIMLYTTLLSHFGMWHCQSTLGFFFKKKNQLLIQRPISNATPAKWNKSVLYSISPTHILDPFYTKMSIKGNEFNPIKMHDLYLYLPTK